MRSTSPSRIPTTSRGQPGFSVIELMAVLAIAGILATTIATSTIARMKRTARQTEATNMGNIADALRGYIQHTRTVPAATNWPVLIASQMNAAVDRVEKTSAGHTRFFALDPSAQLGATNNASLPYIQTQTGSLEPQNARIVIVSSLGGALPAFEMTPGNFGAIWTCPDGAIPICFTNYPGAIEDFRIQRLDLREIFHRVILTNLDPTRDAVYSINAIADQAVITSNQRVERWFIAATPLNLHFADATLQARDILRSDLSYVFENGRWTRYLNYGRQPADTDFTAIVNQFLNSPTPSSDPAAVSPSAVLSEMYVYLTTYATWSSGSSAFAPGTTNAVAPSLRILRDSQQRLDDFTTALLTVTP